MDTRELKRIVEIMNTNDLAEIEIEEEGRRLRLRKMEVPLQPALAVPSPVVASGNPGPAASGAAAAATRSGSAPESEEVQTITAPMVGTFYRAPSPDAEPYVDAGSRVEPESVVCILEAMKVMNEIKAECSGEIVKICVQNGEAVEFGQPLFQVRSA